jgi:hypothetical protein
MAGAIPIDFVLSGLDTTVTMDLCGTLLAEDISVPSAEAVAVFDMCLNVMRDIFKFQTDASDINPDSAGDDIQYSIDWQSWPNTNIAHASMFASDLVDIPAATESVTGATYGSGYARTRSLVKHDFIRHLAQSLFNTYLGVDLFNNEQELKDSLVRAGGVVLNDVVTDLSGAHLLTNSNTTSANIGRSLLSQIGHADPARLTTSVPYGIQATTDFQSIPFVSGDTIIFNVTINPATNQHLLTSVPEIAGRVYRIILNITDNASNPVPDDFTPTGENTIVDYFPGIVGDGVIYA